VGCWNASIDFALTNVNNAVLQQHIAELLCEKLVRKYDVAFMHKTNSTDISIVYSLNSFLTDWTLDNYGTIVLRTYSDPDIDAGKK